MYNSEAMTDEEESTGFLDRSSKVVIKPSVSASTGAKSNNDEVLSHVSGFFSWSKAKGLYLPVMSAFLW